MEIITLTLLRVPYSIRLVSNCVESYSIKIVESSYAGFLLIHSLYVRVFTNCGLCNLHKTFSIIEIINLTHI